MIGSTDVHTSLSAVEEDNFFGKHSGVEPEPHRWEHVVIESPLDPSLTTYGWQMASAGYTGVWAMENTRKGIFDAMARREVYATTGSRMMVRFFGGWDFTEKDAHERVPAGAGYAKGVPMGGDLRAASDGKKAPSFLVFALKDILSGNLDRIQIIKGWMDSRGETHERGLRRGLERRAQARCRRQAPGRRQHCRRQERHVDQQHRIRRSSSLSGRIRTSIRCSPPSTTPG